MTVNADAAELPVDPQELAAWVSAKLCHDFISPAGAIVSGLDLLDDPTAQDMREDAMALISQSAKKLVSLVHFARVAFGAATTSEKFSGVELQRLVAGMIEGGRATMDWKVDAGDFTKPQARALINLAWLTTAALPSGGVATITTRRDGDLLLMEGTAVGARARLKPEVITGLAGERLVEGLAGQWIQPYWLWLTVSGRKGSLTVTTVEGRVDIVAGMPV